MPNNPEFLEFGEHRQFPDPLSPDSSSPSPRFEAGEHHRLQVIAMAQGYEAVSQNSFRA